MAAAFLAALGRHSARKVGDLAREPAHPGNQIHFKRQYRSGKDTE